MMLSYRHNAVDQKKNKNTKEKVLILQFCVLLYLSLCVFTSHVTLNLLTILTMRDVEKKDICEMAS